MPKLKWFGGKDDVDLLVASGKLERAIPLLEARLRDDPESVGCRQRLGDILGRAGYKKRAISVLAPLIDRFAADGFAAKAIAVIKKLERLDPERVNTAHLITKVRKQSGPTEAPPLVAKAIAVIKKLEQLDLERGDTADLVTRELEQPDTSEAPTLISDHLRSDTITLDLFRDDEERPTATSTVDASWFDQMESKHSTFGWSPLLNNLPPKDFDAVVGSLNLLVKNPGAIIIGQGEPATSIFVLASGFARAYRRSDSNRYRQDRVFEEGQFFGEEALFETDARRPITVTAASECELLEIDLASLMQVTAANPAAYHHLEKAYRRRSWAR